VADDPNTFPQLSSMLSTQFFNNFVNMSFMSPLPEGSMDKLNEAILEFTSLFAQFMLLGYFEVSD
jgi:hypothetical protein